MTSGRTATIVYTCLGLAVLGWAARPIVVALAGEHVLFHEVELGPHWTLNFVGVSAVLIVLLVVICLNRVLLHGVAWITAGGTANFGELAATGAVADYVPVGDHLFSAGDVYLTVGIALLGIGALKVVYDALRRGR